MDRQTLRDWVHRYNTDDIPGLKSRHGPGQPPLLTTEQMAELKELVVNGPDPAKDGVVRGAARLSSRGRVRFTPITRTRVCDDGYKSKHYH